MLSLETSRQHRDPEQWLITEIFPRRARTARGLNRYPPGIPEVSDAGAGQRNTCWPSAGSRTRTPEDGGPPPPPPQDGKPRTFRLAAKIAMGYRGYGVAAGRSDLGSPTWGLMQAVKRFDPGEGVPPRDLTRCGGSAALDPGIHPSGRGRCEARQRPRDRRRNLFLQPPQGEGPDRGHSNERSPRRDLRPEHVAKIAHDLNVTEQEVVSMNRPPLGRRCSLNATISADGEGAAQWQGLAPRTIDADPQATRLCRARRVFRCAHSFLMTRWTFSNEREREGHSRTAAAEGRTRHP